MAIHEMRRALLCETVTGRTMGELLAARDAATSADIVELRLDGVAGCDVARALEGRTLPAIVTCRPSWEGGRFDGEDEERRDLLGEALKRGAEYVDVEWRALAAGGGRGVLDALLDQYRDRIVVSAHDFDGMPVDLPQRTRSMRATGAAIIKVAAATPRLCDTLPLLDVAAGRTDTVVIGMGSTGVSTRLLASRFGSRWTYGGNGVAPGQLPVTTMVNDYRFKDIGPHTAVYGLSGEGALESRLPAVMNRAFVAAGVDAMLVPLATGDEEDVRKFSHALGLAGAMKDVDARHHV